jgi:hypothetical protein
VAAATTPPCPRHLMEEGGSPCGLFAPTVERERERERERVRGHDPSPCGLRFHAGGERRLHAGECGRGGERGSDETTREGGEGQRMRRSCCGDGSDGAQGGQLRR